MSLKAMSDYVFVSKYARYLPEKKRRETWGEAVDRVKQMHLRRYPQVSDDIEWAFEQVHKKLVLGSQRALQYGGTPIERKHARQFNCTASFCDRARFFQEAFWLLLCGSGVGFSVQRQHVDRLPGFFRHNKRDKKVYTIQDSIEGWADSLGILLATYLPHPEFPEWEGKEVEFDYSLIRPKGAFLSSGVGKAPGPEPLMRSLEIIRDLLDDRINKFDKIRPIDAYDIVMHSSDAVLSGGIRRSACLCQFSPDDVEMATAKTGNWLAENPQRARSNNSALLLRGNTSRQEYKQLIKSVKEFGEPGVIWSDSTEVCFNPCVEVALFPVDVETGQTGFEFCNLCEINGKAVVNPEDFETAARAGAIIGTLQAGYTDFPYLGKVTERINRRESLLGVSITGLMDNPNILLDPDIQREMSGLVVRVNEEFAPRIGINPSARCTCTKPAGTTSCLLGTASGIHPHHAPRYIRHMQANMLEAPLQHFKTSNPLHSEPSVWSANKTDEVIAFCVEIPEGAKTKQELGAVDLLRHVKSTQENWVRPGRVADRCVQPWLCHNVSNTINVREHEWDEVADYIYDNRDYFAGVSLIPSTGDLDYPQAPMVAVKTREELAMMGDLPAGERLLARALAWFNDDLWLACNVANGLVPHDDSHAEERSAWLRDMDATGDVKKTCYYLKQIYYMWKWESLSKSYADVDYTSMIEEEDGTKIAETVACSGGQCEIF